MNSHINCLVFDSDGKRLYSGDGAGKVMIWNCLAGTGSDRHTSFSHQHTVDGQRAVNSLCLNPRGSRLVVHTRNNLLRTIDTKSFVEYKQYSGLRNERLMIRSDVSPDGRYIVSGSEDGKVYALPNRRSAQHIVCDPSFFVRSSDASGRWRAGSWCPPGDLLSGSPRASPRTMCAGTQRTTWSPSAHMASRSR